MSPLLSPDIQKFIESQTGADINLLALKRNPFPEIEWPLILQQIAARTKAKNKLPTWYSTARILYPSKVSIEQTSSEQTARYKAALVTGNLLIDITGGFGVDSYFFARNIDNVIHCEINAELSAIANHNFQQLGLSNTTSISGDSTETLQLLSNKADWIYIDPSRRNDKKGKVFLLSDCLPNVPSLLPLYFRYSDNVMIKTAPLLDLSAGISELQHVKNIHIIAVENEVKEVLWVLQKSHNNKIQVIAGNILKDTTHEFTFNWGEEYIATFDIPRKYLYEPNAAIMKSGGFNAVSAIFKVDKLHRNSHLYTSEHQIDFPGRTFEIQSILPYSKTTMKQYFQGQKYNITARNFPDSVKTIRNRWKISEGGNLYCFFTSDMNDDKIVLICRKIY